MVLQKSTEYLTSGITKFTISAGPNLPEPLQSHQIVSLNSEFGKKSLVIGGMLEDSIISNRTFYYFHENQTWIEGPTMIQAWLKYKDLEPIFLVLGVKPETGKEICFLVKKLNLVVQ